MVLALSSVIPGTSASLSQSVLTTLSVSSPNATTIFSASAGPTPLIKPDSSTLFISTIPSVYILAELACSWYPYCVFTYSPSIDTLSPTSAPNSLAKNLMVDLIPSGNGIGLPSDSTPAAASSLAKNRRSIVPSICIFYHFLLYSSGKSGFSFAFFAVIYSCFDTSLCCD